MRWGIRDEASDDHTSTELCLKEIETCQRLSVGPNFMVGHGLFLFYQSHQYISNNTAFDTINDIILVDRVYLC